MQVDICDALPRDAAAIADLHCASWRDAYADLLDPEYLAGPIDEERRSFWAARFAAEDPARLVLMAATSATPAAGFVCAQRDGDPQWGSLIDNLHVSPKLRGGGIGERLLRAAARRLLQDGAGAGLHLWVFEANVAGRRFYSRLGGRAAGYDVSRNPAARGAKVLRIHWPELTALTG